MNGKILKVYAKIVYKNLTSYGQVDNKYNQISFDDDAFGPEKCFTSTPALKYRKNKDKPTIQMDKFNNSDLKILQSLSTTSLFALLLVVIVFATLLKIN